MNSLLNIITRGIRPATEYQPEDGVRYWQEKIQQTLLFVGVFPGFFVYVPSVALSIKEELWNIAIADSLIYAAIILLFFNRKLSYNLRAVIFTLITYFLGLILLSVLGPFGAGSAWLFAFPVIAGLLLGLLPSIIALSVNALTLVAMGYLIYHGMMGWHNMTVNPLEKLVVTGLNFLLLNTIVSLSVVTMLKGLQTSLEALGESEKKYKRVFENFLDVYFESTIDGRLLQISPSISKMSQYEPQQLLNGSVFDLYEEPEHRKQMIEQLLVQGSVNDYELNLKDKDGSIKICSINARVVKDETGDAGRIVGSCRDITDRKILDAKRRELEERLSRSRKMEALGLLAGGVAHDLNNILSGIVGYPDLILMDLPQESPLRDSLLTIKASGQRAAEVVQDLLTLSRRGVTDRQVVDLNELVALFIKTPECQAMLSCAPKTVIRTNIKAEAPYLLGSCVHLKKTLMNLISNAVEAMPDGGTVTVSTFNQTLNRPLKGYEQVSHGDYVILRVEDTGLGISPQDIDRIFEPFFTKKVMGRSGTGLGMAVVWGTVQDHDGYINVESTLDEGTKFSLYFPLTHETVTKPLSNFDLNAYMGNGESILVVDDEKPQRDIAETMLRRLNYKVESVEGGEAAVAYLQKRSVDLLILDMIMDPGIDGLETYKRILAFKPEQKTLITSGFYENDRVMEIRALGAGFYLKKPYVLNDLSMAVKSALRT